MKALLKKSCPTCTPSSQKTYFHSIQALSLFAGRQTIPSGPAWLNSALLKKVRALPLQKYKRFTIAGVKALNAYGKTENKAWWDAMRDATDKYTKLRMSGKRTKREAERWPIQHLEELKPNSLDAWQRYQYQRWVIVNFYSHHALRGDLADVQLGKGARSWIRKKKSKSWKTTRRSRVADPSSSQWTRRLVLHSTSSCRW